MRLALAKNARRKRRTRVFAERRVAALLGCCGAGVLLFPHREVRSAGREEAAWGVLRCNLISYL